ncbi:heme ABC transporter substrate-binding protein IsdE [Paenibacillus sp. P96]|uniref:High-affinity heme uptake system protein IsdE n=2 Tax=Paenibacillus zeirhizosphaerae TaxID=2987519 RepID=A0ABT9FR13_9BACL|nr:heme ABC transporter substrate-binding protein IsdE [Paenibacillus sp. P96]MDP4097170.1 heme ABC transporter substrate-binding protein IsdE [Paenibacillus sp. P96]
MGILLLLGTTACVSGSAEPSMPASADSSGNEPRIVSTTVAITEIMDALELDLVGIPTSSKELPERYKDSTPVGNPMSPDLERIRSLHPTDVLSVTTLQYDLEPKFAGAGITSDFLNLQSVSDMQQTIRRLGEKYGRAEQAAAVTGQIDARLAEIKQQVKGKRQPTVLILLGVPGSYLVATEHSFIGDLVKQSGGINIVQGEKVEYLASNTEYLQQANPDIILRAAHGMSEEVVKMFDQEFQQNDIWKHFNAVKNGRVYDLEERLFGTTANLAVGEALDELTGMMYPEIRKSSE